MQKDQNRILHFLSYNIQIGIPGINLPSHMLGSWRHFMPYRGRRRNLELIAKLIADFDIVGLQEVDAGSLRTNFVNQVEHLAELAGFNFWYHQRNRNLGKIAQHSNGLLSRFSPNIINSYKLPSIIPGRGAILAEFGDKNNPLAIVVMHLSLGRRDQRHQLQYICELVDHYEHIILMGDMNLSATKVESLPVIKHKKMKQVNLLHNTYPSWHPVRNIDQILISPGLEVQDVQVLNFSYSDHLPIALQLKLPKTDEFSWVKDT